MGTHRRLLAAAAMLTLVSAALIDVGAASAMVPAPRGVDSAAAKGGWGEPVHVDPRLLAISCPSARFCAAVDDHGDAVTYNGSKWSSPAHVDEYRLDGVSCVSSNFCVAVGSAAFIYDGSQWSSGVDLGDGLGSVSCVATTYCVAVGTYSHLVYSFDGTSWSKTADLVGGNGHVDAVSCGSQTRCVAAGDRWAFVFDGTTWVGTRLIPQRPRFVRLSSAACLPSSLCAVADDAGKVYTYDGSRWSGPTKVIPSRPRHGYNVMTCANTHLCVMVSLEGMASIYHGVRWSKPQRIDPPFEGVTSLACGPGTFCMAVNSAGYAIPYNAR